jgi:hypothetical protein
MADFEDTLLDKSKLIKAFEKLSITDSMTVRANLLGDENEAGAVESLRTVSPELAAMMAKEGIDISMLGGEKKPRKKRVLVLENQNFTHEDDQLKLLISRAVSKYKNDGFKVLSYSELSKSDQKIAQKIVEDHNA